MRLLRRGWDREGKDKGGAQWLLHSVCIGSPCLAAALQVYVLSCTTYCVSPCVCRLIYKDFVSGNGSQPVDGQQVIFDYTGYNESGTIIDSSYRKGRAAEVRLGINGLIPGVLVCVWGGGGEDKVAP